MTLFAWTVCGLRIEITIEEPRCPQCGYLVYMLQSSVCPECGTPLASSGQAADPQGSSSEGAANEPEA